jgi:hypothetical protein
MITQGKPGEILIIFEEKVPAEKYKIHTTGGPTAVSDFQFQLNQQGGGTATIPPNGTAAALQDGTYQLAITRVSTGDVSNFTQPVP